MRRLLLITGEQDWCHEAAQSTLDGWQETLWLTTGPSDGCPPAQAMRFLGHEFDAVVYDIYAGFDPDAFGAIAGTIRDEGVFILLGPPTETWHRFDDPEYARIDAWMPTRLPRKGNALSLLRQALLDTPGLTHLSQQEKRKPVPLPFPERRETRSTADQQAAIDAICHVATGHAKRPLVLIADRGRGKSAALGLAASRLMKQGKQRILVTAPRRSAIEPLFRHAGESLGVNQSTGDGRIEQGDCSLSFLPPDVLIQTHPQADLLLIDEAAAIPAPMLEKLLLTYNRVVFSTTIHGYEGTGRGFAIRFRKSLDRLTPQWRQMELTIPIRWPVGDPLEAFIATALLLDAEPADSQSFKDIGCRSIEIHAVTQSTLLNDNHLLRQVVGLLVSAHYQTRPRDLRQLLDAGNLEITVAMHGQQVAGVILAVREGSFDNELASEILAGRRRPQGNLAPQSLGLHLQDINFPQSSYMRIMRIAVHPALQGSGIGTRLLEFLANKSDTDLMATSFGATNELVQFWKACAFTPARIGVTRDAASGVHSLLMLRALNSNGEALLFLAKARFQATYPLILSTTLEELETDLAIELLENRKGEVLLKESDRERLKRFSETGIPLDAVLPELDASVRSAAATGRLATLPPLDREILVALLLQKRKPQQLLRSLAIDGKRQLQQQLRSAVGMLLAALD